MRTALVFRSEIGTWGEHENKQKTMTVRQQVLSLLTNTPDAPRAKALKTSVPRLTPPSKKTGIMPRVALTTCKKPFQRNHDLRMLKSYDGSTQEMKSSTPFISHSTI